MNSCDIFIVTPSGERVPAYLARSSLAVPRGAIVLLQEIFGVNSNIRSIADDYAANGYDVVAPDLFWRQEPGVMLDPADPRARERATALMKGLDESLAIEDAIAASQHVRTLTMPQSKVGVVGYCLGGKLAYLLATREEIDAAVSYYGVGIHGALDQASTVKCPLLLHVAQQDSLCAPQAQQAIQEALGTNEHVTIVSHPGVGHAFARRGSESHDAEAAARADGASAIFLCNALERAS